MLRAFEPSLKNLDIVLRRLQRYNRAESLHFRKCLGLAKRFGPRGDAYFSLTKIQAGARQESELEESVAFLKFDRSMKEWTEVHVHCPEREDMEQLCDVLDRTLDWTSRICFAGVPSSLSPRLRDLCRLRGSFKNISCFLVTRETSGTALAFQLLFCPQTF